MAFIIQIRILGHISNWSIDEEPRQEVYFDSRMPAAHRTIRQQEALKLEDDVYAIKVENLTNDIT